MLTPKGRLMKTPQKQSFDKLFLTIDKQILNLKAIGMLFKNEEKAKATLENINFYRLSGVWFIFKKDGKFQDNTWKDKLENLLVKYKIDRTMMGYKSVSR